MTDYDEINRKACEARVEANRAERTMEWAFALMEETMAENKQKMEVKWTKEWALFEQAKRRGFQPTQLPSLRRLKPMLWPKMIAKSHACSTQCQQYSNRGRDVLYRFSQSDKLEPKNNVFVCMDTGRTHVCMQTDCLREIRIKGAHTKQKIGAVCMISGYVKKTVISRVHFGDNGFTSTDKLAKAEKKEQEDASDGGYSIGSASESEEEHIMEEGEEVIVQEAKRVKMKKSNPFEAALDRAKLEIKQAEIDEQIGTVDTRPAHKKRADWKVTHGKVTSKMHRKLERLNASVDGERKRKQSEEPVFVFNKARAVTTHQTPEQKTERYLRRGTMHAALDFLELLMSSSTKNYLALYRLQQVTPAVTRDLTDLLRRFSIPHDILLGTFYRQVQKQTGMALYYSPRTVNVKVYAQYILAHWRAAAHTAYANSKHGGAANKQKHHQVLEFNLFCIGMIYYMADGGMVLEERFEPRFPESLKNYEAKLLLKPFKVQEIPSFPELNDMLVNRDFLHELSKCLPKFPNFQIGVEKSGQQLVQNCIRSRHDAARERFYTNIHAEPQKFRTHFDLYVASVAALKPAEG